MKKRSFTAAILFVSFLLLGSVCLASENNVAAQGNGKIIYVYVTACGSCEEAQTALDDISTDIDIEKINILDDIDQVNSLFDKYNVPEDDRIAPIVFSGDAYFAGAKEIQKNIGVIEENAMALAGGEDLPENEDLTEEEISSGTEEILSGTEEEITSAAEGIQKDDRNNESSHESVTPSNKGDAVSLFSSFTIGAANGLNPCALSMLLLFLSVLLQAGTNTAGYAFLFLGIKFTVYLLIGTVFLQVFQRWTPTWLPLATKWILTIFGIAMFLLNLYDAVSVKKEEYGKVKDQLPKPVRKFLRQQISGVTGKRFLGVSVSALAVIVALSEFMCSGQIYLATLLSSIETGMTLRNFGYLLVYCFAFLLPSLIISILVVFGKSRTAISDWLLNRMFLIKVLNCMIFLALVIAAWMI